MKQHDYLNNYNNQNYHLSCKSSY